MSAALAWVQKATTASAFSFGCLNTSSRQGTPNLNPKFFAHDIGHIDDEGLYGEGYEVRDLPHSIWNFSFEASRLYKDKEGNSLAIALSDGMDGEDYSTDDIKEMTQEFFPQNVFSRDPEDEVFDVISAALEGRLMAEIPAKITLPLQLII